MDAVTFTVNETDTTLTPCERGYLPLMAKGLKRKEMAERLHKEPCTVNTHIMHIQQKLCAPNSTAAVTAAIARGILTVSMMVIFSIGLGSADDDALERARLNRFSRTRTREWFVS